MDRQALDGLRSGDVEQCARAYRDRGQITVGESAPATSTALINDWARADGDRLMIPARRDDVRDLNERARQFLQHEGSLGPDELSVGGRGYAAGDRVVGAKNDRGAGILNGQRGTVSATHPDAHSVDVALDNGSRARLGTASRPASTSREHMSTTPATSHRRGIQWPLGSVGCWTAATQRNSPSTRSRRLTARRSNSNAASSASS